MNLNKNSLVGIDILRFLLSISILIVHFPHFSFPFIKLENFSKVNYPFYKYLSLIYEHGSFAVEIFWMISGIIFYQVYYKVIVDKDISFLTFLKYRFTRLYPIHLLTLFTVMVLQSIYYKNNLNYFIYYNNDFLHFILNIFMINFWNPKFGLSFNGPFWSVSVEIFVYIVFFIFSFMNLLNSIYRLFLFLILFFFFYCFGILSPFYECFLFFFTGCFLVSILNTYSLKHVLSFLIVNFLLSMLITKNVHLKNEYLQRILNCIFELNISVLIITIFSIIFNKSNFRFQKFSRYLGNMTYSIYMIHISLQLILVILFYNKGHSYFLTEIFFIKYISICLFISFFIYKYYEKKVQNILRSLLIK